MQLFTPEDLLRYLYKESSQELTMAIEKALKEDFTLRERLQQMELSVNQINVEKELVAPRMEVVLRVLQYARETATEAASHS
ncbi:MAG TPA: hypothetical protein VG890_02045 [Puia sp.]|nr:hypothetical protein [Puia sp.]